MQDIAPIGSSYLPYPLFQDTDTPQGDFLEGKYTLGPRGDITLMHDVLDVIEDATANQETQGETD